MSQELTLVGGINHRVEVVLAHLVLFRLFGDGGHRLHRFEGIFSRSRFTTQHESVGAVVDSVGNVGHFGASGARIVDHGVEHLRSHDDGLLLHHTFVNNLALNAGNTLDGHFDAEVAARNHHTVGRIDDLIDVVHAFLVLNLRDDLDVAAVCVENVLNSLHVGGAAHEGVGDKVDIFLDGEENVLFVALRKGGQVDVPAGHVHTLVRTERTVVLYRDVQRLFVLCRDEHVDGTVVKKHMVAHFHIANEVGIRHVDDIVGGIGLRAATNANALTGLVVDGCAQSGGAHLGALGVDEQSQVRRDSAHVANDFLDAVGRSVCGVHTHHVHTGEKQLTQEIFVAAQVADRADDLGLFHYRGDFVYS